MVQEEKNSDDVGTADDKSGDSGGDVRGIAATTVASHRVVLKKLQRGNNYCMAEDFLCTAEKLRHALILPMGHAVQY